MFGDRLDTDRFFARIRSLDLECPKCGTIYLAAGRHAQPFNRQTGQFTCGHCGLVLSLGVLAYPTTRSPQQDKIPRDWTPTPRQALALREAAGGFWARTRRPPQDDRNLVLRDGCRCVLQGTALLVHPGCPVHGARARAGD